MKTLENQKYTQSTRINIHLLIILLSPSPRDTQTALRNLNLDLNNESEALNEFLKKYIIMASGIKLILWRLENSRSDMQIVSNAVDMLLNLSTAGVHYDDYINELSDEDSIRTIFLLFESSPPEITEKLAVII